eukprot:325339-Rhodomonas_salina.2
MVVPDTSMSKRTNPTTYVPLRSCCALSRTDLGMLISATIGSQMSGTDLVYVATRYALVARCPVLTYPLRTYCAVSATDL